MEFKSSSDADRQMFNAEDPEQQKRARRYLRNGEGVSRSWLGSFWNMLLSKVLR